MLIIKEDFINFKTPGYNIVVSAGMGLMGVIYSWITIFGVITTYSLLMRMVEHPSHVLFFRNVFTLKKFYILLYMFYLKYTDFIFRCLLCHLIMITGESQMNVLNSKSVSAVFWILSHTYDSLEVLWKFYLWYPAAVLDLEFHTEADASRVQNTFPSRLHCITFQTVTHNTDVPQHLFHQKGLLVLWTFILHLITSLHSDIWKVVTNTYSAKRPIIWKVVYCNSNPVTFWER